MSKDFEYSDRTYEHVRVVTVFCKGWIFNFNQSVKDGGISAWVRRLSVAAYFWWLDHPWKPSDDLNAKRSVFEDTWGVQCQSLRAYPDSLEPDELERWCRKFCDDPLMWRSYNM